MQFQTGLPASSTIPRTCPPTPCARKLSRSTILARSGPRERPGTSWTTWCGVTRAPTTSCTRRSPPTTSSHTPSSPGWRFVNPSPGGLWLSWWGGTDQAGGGLQLPDDLRQDDRRQGDRGEHRDWNEKQGQEGQVRRQGARQGWNHCQDRRDALQQKGRKPWWSLSAIPMPDGASSQCWVRPQPLQGGRPGYFLRRACPHSHWARRWCHLPQAHQVLCEECPSLSRISCKDLSEEICNTVPEIKIVPETF